MYNYVVIWQTIDEEGFELPQSLICENLEEVKICKYNLEMMGVETIKAYSLQEVKDSDLQE